MLAASIPLGCLSIAQGSSTHAGSDDLAPSATAQPQQQPQHLLQQAQSIYEAHKAALAPITSKVQRHLQQHQSQIEVVATGGTVTTLAALHLQLPEYLHEAVHFTRLRRHDIEQALQRWCGVSDCAGWPRWLTAARAATLAPGCAGLLSVMDGLGFEEMVVSDCDLLDGVVADLQHQCCQ